MATVNNKLHIEYQISLTLTRGFQIMDEASRSLEAIARMEFVDGYLSPLTAEQIDEVNKRLAEDAERLRNQGDDYYYIAVRTDLPIADQMCQVAHVATDAGRYFGIHEKCNLVLLQVKNREALFKLERLLTKHQIQHTMQVEHDDERKETALATQMVFGETRRLFRKYRIWTEPKMDWKVVQGPMMEVDVEAMIADIEADTTTTDAEIVE